MVGLFGDYAVGAAWDEMFQAPGVPRAAYDAVLAALKPFGPAELRFRSEQLSRVFTDRGVTFAHAGEERPFPLDLLPRVIAAVEWDHIAAGVKQRVRALEAFLADGIDRQGDGVIAAPLKALIGQWLAKRGGAA